MLPRLDPLLVDCSNEAELHLFGRQHQHYGELRITVISLNGEEAMLCRITTGNARALQELAVYLGLASGFVQGRCCRLSHALANLQQLLERARALVSLLLLPDVLFLDGEGMAHDLL